MVKVRAPASTANLGPGFDCLAGAVSIGLEVTATDGSSDGGGLVERAIRAVTGRNVDHAIEINSEIPVGRGLGSSGACVAAGLLIGCEISGKQLDLNELLAIGTPLEGHPDNLAASLYGGLTLALVGGEVLRFTPHPGVRPFVLVPEEELSTSQARSVLPADIPREAAVANIARASGLLALLIGGSEPSTDSLLACTEDLIHQPYRAPLMPKTAQAVKRLREAGIPAAVSGAGPSVVCLVVATQEDATRAAAGHLEGWELMELDWDTRGVHVVEE